MRRKSYKAPAQLVRESVAAKPTISWYEQLHLANQEYVCRVVGEMRKNPDAACALVAKGLIAELSIKRSVDTVVRTLKELMRNGKK